MYGPVLDLWESRSIATKVPQTMLKPGSNSGSNSRQRSIFEAQHWLSDWAPDLLEIGVLFMFSFRKSGKTPTLNGRHFSVLEPQQAAVDRTAQADAFQLRDLDPVHTFTATAELRGRDARYEQVWPSDIPHRRR